MKILCALSHKYAECLTAANSKVHALHQHSRNASLVAFNSVEKASCLKATRNAWLECKCNAELWNRQSHELVLQGLPQVVSEGPESALADPFPTTLHIKVNNL